MYTPYTVYDRVHGKYYANTPYIPVRKYKYGVGQPHKLPYRKRKLFAQQDQPHLIQKEGLNPQSQCSVFKLDVFDDTDFESRLGCQWVPKTPGTL